MFVTKKNLDSLKHEIEITKECLAKDIKAVSGNLQNCNERIDNIKICAEEDRQLIKEVNKSFLNELSGLKAQIDKIGNDFKVVGQLQDQEFNSVHERLNKLNELIEIEKHDKEILKKEVEVLVKIVCHMSGAKEGEGRRDHFFDEVLKRLAKLETREDLKNGT